MALIFILAVFVTAAFGVHLACCTLVAWRLRGQGPLGPGQDHPPLTVLRPVCGSEPGLARTLASSFTHRTAEYEVIFCIADAGDPAIPLIRGIMAANARIPARLLIGETAISGNPKLNNLEKGWAAARHPWIVMIDSNVLLPPDYVQRLFGTWGPDTGVVTSPPAGIEARGFAANIEAAFLNTHQDVWQLAGDQVGQGFAQGKVLMWRRALLDAAGGLAALGHDLAEDVAATKVVRAAGLRVRVIARPFAQPLGRRALAEVWARQVRWARVRRDGFPALFAPEILTGGLPPLMALGALAAVGAVPVATVAGGAVLWYGAQWIVAARAGWPRDAAQVAAWPLRDMMIPAVWVAALMSRGFVWRGNAMAPGTPLPAATPESALSMTAE